MKKTLVTGCTCIGELRLCPIDIGFDIRKVGMTVRLPDTFKSVGIEKDGETYLIVGTREEMLAEIRAAGYRVGDDDRETVAPGDDRYCRSPIDRWEQGQQP